MTAKVSRNDLKDFLQRAAGKVSDSIGDMIVTVAITGITLAYMFSIIPEVYSSTLPGLYLFGMIVQLFIRIVHRFDESYTTDELAERVIEFEDSINQRLDKIISDMAPY